MRTLLALICWWRPLTVAAFHHQPAHPSFPCPLTHSGLLPISLSDSTVKYTLCERMDSVYYSHQVRHCSPM